MFLYMYLFSISKKLLKFIISFSKNSIIEKQDSFKPIIRKLSKITHGRDKPNKEP